MYSSGLFFLMHEIQSPPAATVAEAAAPSAAPSSSSSTSLAVVLGTQHRVRAMVDAGFHVNFVDEMNARVPTSWWQKLMTTVAGMCLVNNAILTSNQPHPIETDAS